MQEKHIRTAMLIGEENVAKLRESSVLLFGVGGVGSVSYTHLTLPTMAVV